ncbi:hypothetical protein HUT19_28195 [Streptomyces sp. NA02950]|uniref:hypothetical protein n=1 Tax=Streptomyces sp. NA02950 TaxID=2742137 RepID=UPI0015915EA2|nr:hypothetical protein [Streptomyces sp. NA02950]QKV95142.1 hypothetical protein HUT19_28195 [Streptomyces sp. NA02950]
MRAMAVGASAFCAVAFGGVSAAQAQSWPSSDALIASALGGTVQENHCETNVGPYSPVAGGSGDTNIGSKCSNVSIRTVSEHRQDQHRQGQHRQDQHRQGQHRQDQHRQGQHRQDQHRQDQHRQGQYGQGQGQYGQDQYGQGQYGQDRPMVMSRG